MTETWEEEGGDAEVELGVEGSSEVLEVARGGGEEGLALRLRCEKGRPLARGGVGRAEKLDFGEVGSVTGEIRCCQGQIQYGAVCADKEIWEGGFGRCGEGLFSAVLQVTGVGFCATWSDVCWQVQDDDAKGGEARDGGLRCLFADEVFGQDYGVDGCAAA